LTVQARFSRAIVAASLAAVLFGGTRQWRLLSTDFPGVGAVHCSGKAAAPNDYLRTIECVGSKGEVLARAPIGEEVEPKERGIELQRRSIAGFPDPLLVGVAASPHGSTTNWQVMLLGFSNGHLKTLRAKPFEVWTGGGIYVGDLGAQFGPGVAIWKFLWDDCHLCPSRFDLEFYPWDQETGSFSETPSATRGTTERFATGIEAIRSLGLPYSNSLEEFRTLRSYW
jgi:hypothetical protein